MGVEMLRIRLMTRRMFPSMAAQRSPKAMLAMAPAM